MAQLISLNTYVNESGRLTVIEKLFSFNIQRIFFIYGLDDKVRGMHRHKKTIQAAVCMQGSCTIFNQLPNDKVTQEFQLNQPDQCLMLFPEDFHWMSNFSSDCILMVMASTSFDPDDYIYQPYFPVS